MPTQQPRFCITVSKELLDEIDDYRFENRINSRSMATVELIQLGLNALRKEADAKKVRDEK